MKIVNGQRDMKWVLWLLKEIDTPITFITSRQTLCKTQLTVQGKNEHSPSGL